MSASLCAVCHRFDFVREADGPNAGVWVNLFQRFTGNKEGESWCCSFVCFCLDALTKGHSPFKKSGACQDIYEQAKARGLVIDTPEVGCLYVFVNDDDHAHHIGVVTSVSPLRGIAGNTSEDGTSSNGDGVYEHSLNVAPNHIRFIRVPLA
jgi:hypothetical protein